MTIEPVIIQEDITKTEDKFETNIETPGSREKGKHASIFNLVVE